MILRPRANVETFRLRSVGGTEKLNGEPQRLGFGQPSIGGQALQFRMSALRYVQRHSRPCALTRHLLTPSEPIQTCSLARQANDSDLLRL